MAEEKGLELCCRARAAGVLEEADRVLVRVVVAMEVD